MDISRSTWISQSSYKTFLLTYLDLVIPVPDLLNLWDLLKLHPNNGIKQHNMHNCFNSHFSSRSGLAGCLLNFPIKGFGAKQQKLGFTISASSQTPEMERVSLLFTLALRRQCP